MTGRRVPHVIPGPRAVLLVICICLVLGGLLAIPGVRASAKAVSVAREPYPAATPRATPGDRSSARRSATPSTTPSPSPSPSPATPQQGDCSPLDATCQAEKAINDWFADLVSNALKLVLPAISSSLLSTSDVTADPRVQDLWKTSAWIANSCYVLFVLAAGITLLTGYGTDSRYTFGQIAPRLVIGVVAGNTSLIIIRPAITFANALSAALLGSGFKSASLFAVLEHHAASGLMLPFMVLVAVILGIVVVATYVVRLMLAMLLTAAAPLFLACHALPQTERFATWWWRAMAGILAIQSAQALVLATAIKVWFTGTRPFPGFDHPEQAFTDVLLVICLMYVAARIPFWVWRLVTGHGVGASPITGAVRFVLYTVVVGRVARVLRSRP